jgi:hypothetical protein
MTIRNVRVLAGFRFVLTNEDKWAKFVHELHEHVHGDEGSDNGSEHEDDNGSEHSCDECKGCEGCEGSDCDDCNGSDCGSEHSDEHCEHEDDEVDEFDAVWDNMDTFIEQLREQFPEIEYHTIKCFHNKEGMDRMIDIGFEMGDFSICGDNEGSYDELDRSVNALKSAQAKKFVDTMTSSFMWKYCTNKRKARQLGQADNCMFCDSE